MGCCSSSTAKTTEAPNSPPPHTASSAPPDEESVVKEVLSETPISKPPPQPHSQLLPNSISSSINNIFPPTPHHPPPPTHNPITQFISSHQQSNPLTAISNTSSTTYSLQQSNPPPLRAGLNRRKLESKEDNTPEVSQPSEISTSTTVTEIRDDEATSKKRVLNPSPRKLPRNRPYSGDRQPPTRRERPINGGVRWEVSRAVKRDIGEASGRRSRSPVTRVGGGVGKGRGAGSPGKVTGGVGNRLVEKEGENKDGNSGVSGEEQESESLENPLVSLECFIFL